MRSGYGVDESAPYRRGDWAKYTNGGGNFVQYEMRKRLIFVF